VNVIRALVVVGACLSAAPQTPDPPLAEKRLTVHTLLREDIFAGILDNDLDRLARAEKNMDILLTERPGDKQSLLIYKAGATLYRGILALEAKQTKEFEEKYAQAIEQMAQAKKLNPDSQEYAVLTGGIYVLLADRLPDNLRAKAWAYAYEAYQALWKAQQNFVKQLPIHLRGELLGGMAQSAQRTGHDKELAESLDKILTLAPDSAYARVAKKWKEDPKAAKETRLTCLSCHAAGRLAARQAALEKK
jgi:tetratricopeptide (TPR) repeat protein